LKRHPQVRDAVVLVQDDGAGQKRLVAYVVSGQGSDAKASAKTLQEHSREQLPDYMIPTAYVWLESLPLTANGKLNRRALPVPDQTGFVSGAYEAPRGEAEEVLLGGGALLEAGAGAVEEGVDGSLATEEGVDALGDGAALVRVEVPLAAEDVIQGAVGKPSLVSHRAVRFQGCLGDEVLAQRPLRPGLRGLEGARHLRSLAAVP